MASINQIHNDTHGDVIWAWLEVIAGFFCLIVGYTIGIPLNYIVANALIEAGAPAAPIFFLEKLLAWTFVGMGILLIFWGFMYGYKRTTDSGTVDSGFDFFG